jgi:hypothetical protein
MAAVGSKAEKHLKKSEATSGQESVFFRITSKAQKKA